MMSTTDLRWQTSTIYPGITWSPSPGAPQNFTFLENDRPDGWIQTEYFHRGQCNNSSIPRLANLIYSTDFNGANSWPVAAGSITDPSEGVFSWHPENCNSYLFADRRRVLLEEYSYYMPHAVGFDLEIN